MLKNVSGQSVDVFAFDYSTGAPKTGDAANITVYLSKDDGSLTALTDTSATEISSSNAPGWYRFDVSQSESNADKLLFTGKSSTSNVTVVCGPARYTRPRYFGDSVIDSSGRYDISKIAGTSQTARDIGASVLLSSGTGTGQLDFTSGVVKSNLTQASGTAIASSAGYIRTIPEVASRVIWVTKAGNNSNGGFSYADAKLTIAGAVAIARNGDTIWIGDGTYSEQVDLWTATLKNITLVGQSKSGVIVTATVSGFFAVIQGYEGCKVKNMTVTTATNNGTAISFLDHSNCSIEDVNATGVWDCVANGKTSNTPIGFVARRCRFVSKGDVLNLYGAKNFLVEDCTLTTDSTGISVPVVGSEPTNCIIAAGGQVGVVRNCYLSLTRGSAYNSTNYKSAGIIAGGAGSMLTVENSTISVTATGASDNGDIRGIASHYSSPEELHVRLVNTEIVTTKTNASQNAYDIDASTSGSNVSYANCRIDASKLNGASNINSDLIPTTVGRTLDVSSTGEAGIDWANVGSPTTTQNLSGTTVKNASDIATTLADGTNGLAAIKTAAEAAADAAGNAESEATDAKVAAQSADTKLGTPAGDSIADDIAAIAEDAGTPADIATEPIAKNKVFTLVQRSSGLESEDTKTIIAGSPPGTYAIDFRNDAAANQKIYDIDSITLVSGSEGGVTFGTPERDGGTQVRVRITGVTAGNYKALVKGTYVGGGAYRGYITIKVVD